MANAAKTVVITGATAGIGRATAQAFARAGWRVALLAREAGALADTRAELEALGAEVITDAVDVADARAVDAAAGAVAARWGGIDVWINNAMATVFAPVDEVDPAEYARVTAVTYLGIVHGTQAALRHMRKRDAGSIVQVGSALSYRAIPLQSAYCAAKFAARGFTDALRSELFHQRSNIRLCMVQLPAVDTPQFDWARSRMPRRMQPVGPVHDPAAIGEAIHRAALRMPREAWIGLPTLKAIVGQMVVPAWLDRMLARKAWEGQMTQDAETARPDNLFEPVVGKHALRGRFGDRAKPKVRSFDAGLVRASLAGAGVVLMAALVAWGLAD